MKIRHWRWIKLKCTQEDYQFVTPTKNKYVVPFNDFTLSFPQWIHLLWDSITNEPKHHCKYQHASWTYGDRNNPWPSANPVCMISWVSYESPGKPKSFSKATLTYCIQCQSTKSYKEYSCKEKCKQLCIRIYRETHIHHVCNSLLQGNLLFANLCTLRKSFDWGKTVQIFVKQKWHKDCEHHSIQGNGSTNSITKMRNWTITNMVIATKMTKVTFLFLQANKTKLKFCIKINQQKSKGMSNNCQKYKPEILQLCFVDKLHKVQIIYKWNWAAKEIRNKIIKTPKKNLRSKSSTTVSEKLKQRIQKIIWPIYIIGYLLKIEMANFRLNNMYWYKQTPC